MNRNIYSEDDGSVVVELTPEMRADLMADRTKRVTARYDKARADREMAEKTPIPFLLRYYRSAGVVTRRCHFCGLLYIPGLFGLKGWCSREHFFKWDEAKNSAMASVPAVALIVGHN